MSIIYNNTNHMYISEVNKEDEKLKFSFSSSPSCATRFDEKDKDLVKAISENPDMTIIELD